MPDDASVPPPAPAALHAQVERLTRRVDALERLNRHFAASSALQALRAGANGSDAMDLRRQVLLMRASTIWRATWPLRLLLDLTRGGPPSGSAEAVFARHVLHIARRQGVRAAWADARAQLARRKAARAAAAEKPAVLPALPAATTSSMPPPNTILAPNVLIIAELTLPQCAKYRVWQKQELLLSLGVPCRVVDWRYTDECLSAAALATQAILYRVPGYPVVQKLIAHLHALHVPVAWEVDDLIFDHDLFLQNRNVQELDADLRESITSGVDLYRSAMLACGRGIASTPCLAETMRQAGLADVAVVENALDTETLGLAAALRAARVSECVDSPCGQKVVVAYGSGTKTHDADFRQAETALLHLLAELPHVHLRIVGELTLAPGFAAFADRVEHLPPVVFPRYLELLAESDICIAPLEKTLFNDAKSNIKFLEGAILGLPCVCSPRAQFTEVIRHGENGFLAESEAEWFDALRLLVGDAALRRRLGAAGLQTALVRYDPVAVARNQVARLLDYAPDRRPAAELRVLFANIYYAPRSFGGATLVVEEMARRLAAMKSISVHVVTGLAPEHEDRVLTRTQQGDIPVFSLPVSQGDAVGEFDNPSAGMAFGEVLDAVRPDVVHLHAVQFLSVSLATACLERGIPYVITLHDAWWLCARQFMVRENGEYCFQERIDLRVCQNCMPGARHLEQRAALMRTVLDGASLLLSPSEAHRKLYLANGIVPEKIEVAPNGVRMPRAGLEQRRRGEVLRFAYVGGDVAVKGFGVVKAAFESLTRGDWELVLVDNTQKLGFSSIDVEGWTVQGRLSVVPAYTQDEIDAFFGGIDVLLFPSQWRESFGLTVREALVRGVWVIATEGGGQAEPIEHGRNGSIIPLDGRPDGLRCAVDELLDEPDLILGFTNPTSASLIDFQAQADALQATLTQIVRK